MAASLFHQWPIQFEKMSWVDVDSAEDLKREYDTRVPLLMVDKAVICEHFLDLEKVSACFGAPANPVS